MMILKNKAKIQSNDFMLESNYKLKNFEIEPQSDIFLIGTLKREF